jgi:hypothetical protein
MIVPECEYDASIESHARKVCRTFGRYLTQWPTTVTHSLACVSTEAL